MVVFVNGAAVGLADWARLEIAATLLHFVSFDPSLRSGQVARNDECLEGAGTTPLRVGDESCLLFLNNLNPQLAEGLLDFVIVLLLGNLAIFSRQYDV